MGKIVAIAHLYHHDLWDEFKHYLNNIPGEFDLIVSVPESSPVVGDILSYDPTAVVLQIKNRGRDIGGFTASFNYLVEHERSYDFFVLMHSKKSIEHSRRMGVLSGQQCSCLGTKWRLQLLHSILCNPDRVLNILGRFYLNDKLGMIGSSQYISNNPGQNVELIKELRKQYGVKSEGYRFVAGTMFWARYRPFYRFFKRNHISLEDYESYDERQTADGDRCHAMERIFGDIITDAGYEISGIPCEYDEVFNEFDWKYYADRNLDVKQALGENPEKLKEHYDQWGRNEGRVGSEFNMQFERFDADFYGKKYSGLAKLLKNDKFLLRRHYILHGYKEKKQCCAAHELRKVLPPPLKDQAYRSQPKSDVKLIAFYLPQFHPIAENDEWWGKGFTEWTNVSKAKAVYPNHYQPHLPSDLGFYDLRLPDVRLAQASMASQYGVHGFCYYYYWFNGRKVLQRPIEEMLKTREPNFPFCVCWANENWTRGWDGLNKEVLLEQRHSREDSVAFMREMVQYFKDDRYIRVGNRPLLLIYRPSLIPELEETVRDWNRVCEENGLERPYLCWVLCFDNKLTNYTKVGFEAAVQLPPHWVQSVDSFFEVKELRDDLAIDPEKSEARLFPYESLARDFAEMQYDQLTFKTVSPSWDNTARRPKGGWIFHGSTPLKYCNWLRNAIASAENNKPEERLVFINAWNEWGEGCHLEPDRRYGHRHLQATWLALNRTRKP